MLLVGTGDGLRTGIFVGDEVGVVASGSVDLLVGTMVTDCCGDAGGGVGAATVGDGVGDLFEVGVSVDEGAGFSVCGSVGLSVGADVSIATELVGFGIWLCVLGLGF